MSDTTAMARQWLPQIRGQGKMKVHPRDTEVAARCGLVFMSVAHLISTLLFVPKLDVMYLGLAVVIAFAVRANLSKSHCITCLLADIAFRHSRLCLVRSSCCAAE